MNENLDLTKILEGCPTGTKFYSNVYGKVDFSRIISDDYGKCSIELMGYNKDTYSISAVYCEKDGTFSYDYEGECILFRLKNNEIGLNLRGFGINRRLRGLIRRHCSHLIRCL